MQDQPTPDALTLRRPPPADSAAARPARARRHWLAVAVVLLLAAAGGYASLPLLLGPEVAVDRVARADYVQSVVATGNVAAPNRVNIGSVITGVVAAVPVAEGQRVRKGEVLIRLDDREANAAVVLAEGAVAQAEARMRQMRELTLPSAQEALRQAEATFANAQKTYDRAATLARDAYGTIAALDQATRDLNIARAQVRNAQFAVYTSSPGGSDFTLAETQLAQARASLDTARARLGYTLIAAPIDGTLISRDVEIGYVVQPGNVLMRLSPAGRTQLVVDVDEKNIGRIRLGQPALASADAYPDRNFPARVAYINPGVDIDRATVQVKLDIPDPPAYLLQDMTVSVDIETARHPGALLLPFADIHDAAGAAPWVLLAEDGRARRRAVRLGLRDAGHAEILDGLREGDAVIPPAAGLAEGARLRVRAGR